jgi:hypothetical protein
MTPDGRAAVDRGRGSRKSRTAAGILTTAVGRRRQLSGSTAAPPSALSWPGPTLPVAIPTREGPASPCAAAAAASENAFPPLLPARSHG